MINHTILQPQEIQLAVDESLPADIRCRERLGYLCDQLRELEDLALELHLPAWSKILMFAGLIGERHESNQTETV